MGTEGGQNITKVDGVFRVPVEIRTHGQPWSGNAIDHCTIAQNGKIERCAIEGDKLWCKLSDTINKRLYQCLLGPLVDIWCAKGVDDPTTIVLMSNQSADADY